MRALAPPPPWPPQGGDGVLALGPRGRPPPSARTSHSFPPSTGRRRAPQSPSASFIFSRPSPSISSLPQPPSVPPHHPPAKQAPSHIPARVPGLPGAEGSRAKNETPLSNQPRQPGSRPPA